MKKETKIAIVEDNKFFNEIIKNSLVRNFQEVKIETYYSTKEFLAKKHGPYDLLITDYYLGKGNISETAVDLINSFKKENKATPIILVSTMDDIERATSTFKLGINDYLIKDDNFINNLLKSVYNILEYKSLLKRNIRIKEISKKQFNKTVFRIAAVIMLVIALTYLLS